MHCCVLYQRGESRTEEALLTRLLHLHTAHRSGLWTEENLLLHLFLSSLSSITFLLCFASSVLTVMHPCHIHHVQVKKVRAPGRPTLLIDGEEIYNMQIQKLNVCASPIRVSFGLFASSLLLRALCFFGCSFFFVPIESLWACQFFLPFFVSFCVTPPEIDCRCNVQSHVAERATGNSLLRLRVVCHSFHSFVLFFVSSKGEEIMSHRPACSSITISRFLL